MLTHVLELRRLILFFDPPSTQFFFLSIVSGTVVSIEYSFYCFFSRTFEILADVVLLNL